MHASLIAVALAASAATYTWPDPQQNGLVLVNANQDMAVYLRNHPDWFRAGELVLDLSVRNQNDAAAAARERDDIVAQLAGKGLTAGTYTSGTTVEPLAAIQLWPFDKAPVEWMPPHFASTGSWPGDAARKMVDVRDHRARRALQEGMRRLWRQTGAPIRFVDNAAAHSSTGGTLPWQAYCDNMREIRLMAESMGSRVAFNVAMHPAMLSDADMAQLIAAVGAGNGILMEDPWGAATRESADLSARAQTRYRQLLNAGIAIVALTGNVPPAALLAWVASWRRRNDRLYIGWPFFKDPGKRPWEETTK